MRALTLLLILLPAAATHGQSVTYEEVRPSERVRVFIPAELGVANTTAILREDGVVIVDPGASPGAAAQVLDAIADAGPVTHVILTHWHDDHVFATQAYSAAFPQAEIIAHPDTLAGIRDRAAPSLADNVVGLRARLAERDAMLESGTDGDGVALTAERRAQLEARNRVFRQLLAELEATRIVLPDRLVQDELELEGSPTVRISHWGAAHTPGDLLVEVEAEGLVVAGDLVATPFPGATESYPASWSKMLERLVAEAPPTIVPGHGPIVELAEVARLGELLARIAAGAQRLGIEAGPDELLETLELADLEMELVGGDERMRAGFERFFLRPALESALREAREQR